MRGRVLARSVTLPGQFQDGLSRMPQWAATSPCEIACWLPIESGPRANSSAPPWGRRRCRSQRSNGTPSPVPDGKKKKNKHRNIHCLRCCSLGGRRPSRSIWRLWKVVVASWKIIPMLGGKYHKRIHVDLQHVHAWIQSLLPTRPSYLWEYFT